MSPLALSSAMAGFAQKLPHFSEGRVFTQEKPRRNSDPAIFLLVGQGIENIE